MPIQITGVSKVYPKSKKVLDIGGICLPANDITVILGKNKSGKTTLLKCVGGLLAFDSGEIVVSIPAAGSVPAINYTLQPGKRIGADLRRRIGYIFQEMLLWNHLSVIDNITHPLTRVHPNVSREEALKRARDRLGRFGINDDDDLHCYPSKLSGGQQRKVAIARTLAIKPDLLLIDELEANLDQESIKLVMEIIKDDFINEKKTVLMVSHSIDLLEEFNPHILELHEGKEIACEKGVTGLLTKDYETKERAKLIKDSVDSSTSRWFLAKQSLEAAIRLSEINLAEKSIDVLFVKMGEELSKLISQFEPDAEHLLLISTPIKRQDRDSTNKVLIRCAEQSQDFRLDGSEAKKLEPFVQTLSVQDGKHTFEFVKGHRSRFETHGGFALKNKPGTEGSSLIDIFLETNGEKLKYRCSKRHDEIKGVYHIPIPIPKDPADPDRWETERRSYYQFSTETGGVYLIGCTINDEVKGIISIDTTSEQKLSNFLIQQLILIGNMVAIAIKNHEESGQ
jgi:ABC-type polar amino acid transport system ATPase subunit